MSDEEVNTNFFAVATTTYLYQVITGKNLDAISKMIHSWPTYQNIVDELIGLRKYHVDLKEKFEVFFIIKEEGMSNSLDSRIDLSKITKLNYEYINFIVILTNLIKDLVKTKSRCDVMIVNHTKIPMTKVGREVCRLYARMSLHRI